MTLSKAFDARIHVATVVRDVDTVWQTQRSLLSYEMMIAEAEKRLAAIVSDTFAPDSRPNTTVGLGSVYREILRIAREIDADLIVMASHRPEMKDYLIGPNAARIVRHATCSVLVVRDS